MGRLVPVVLILGILASAGVASAQAFRDQVDEVAKKAETLIGAPADAVPAPRAPPGPEMTLHPGAIGAGLILSALVAGGIRHVTRQNVLDHPARTRIYRFLWETGGANLRTIADRLELSTTNATWHLDKLTKAELVGEVASSGSRMYYPRGAGRVARDLCQARGVLANENARAVLAVVRREPGAHQREIARVLGVNHGTVRWHLQKLEEVGLVQPVETPTRVRGFAATPMADQALEPAALAAGPLTQVPEGNL